MILIRLLTHIRLSIFLVISVALFFSNVANADVSLSKFRIYFDSKSRSDSIQIRNTSSTPMSYRAELSINAMTEEGLVYAVTEDPLTASTFIRYSPKRGNILPGERQALRFALRKPAGLADGEYRANLRLVTEIAPGTNGNVNLASKLAYNIPIIVRHGRITAEASMVNPSTIIYNGKPHVQVWLKRSGNRSLFGNFIIEDAQGEEIGVLNNVAVYRPLERRKVLIPLQNAKKGPVVIRFTEIDKFGGDIALSIEHVIK
jgi:fimbrial chaperone protein